ncbi:MAG: glycosyltransferase [Clostridia bacterium]|nr:glycosyltransferase [Clostridia bacterium]
MKNIIRQLYRYLKQLAKTIYFYIAKPLSSKHITEDSRTAREGLSKFSPNPNKSALTNNILFTPFYYELQIIIPAYNVEAYVKECLDSVLNQKTKYKIKVILIDDGSTDKTGEIVDSYSDSRLEVIHQENRGFSGARNRGLEKIFAKYIMFLDSDDKLTEGSIDALLDCAFEHDCDIVEGGYDFLRDSNQYHGFAHKNRCALNSQLDLYGLPVAKVYKSELFENIKFPPDYWFEDSICAFLIFPKAKNIWSITDIVYIYRMNLNGITHTAPKKIKCVDTYWVTEKLMEDRVILGLENNNEYQERFYKQIILNEARIKNMPIEIKEDIFVLTCELFEKYLASYKPLKKYKVLYKTLKTKNYGVFSLYAKTHQS